MVRTVTVYGYSDDLIQIESDDNVLVEEIYVPINLRTFTEIRFDEGTSLRVHYNNDGDWEITRSQVGAADFQRKVFEEGESSYRGTVFLTGDLNAYIVDPYRTI